jgi:hypothetical protein
MPCWIGDFGFVTELDRLDARQAFICELYEMPCGVSEIADKGLHKKEILRFVTYRWLLLHES